MAGEQILVVEPGMAVQELCRAVLEREGYQVTVSSNAAAALACPELSSIDLLLVNNDLAGVSAEELVRMLRAQDTTVSKPVILLINDTQAPETHSIETFSAQGWLQTPFEPEVLAKKVRLVLESSHLLAQEREVLYKQAREMTRSITEEALFQGINTHIREMLDKASQQIQDELKRLISSQLEGTTLELSAQKMQQVVENVTRMTAREHLVKVSDEVARQSVAKLLTDMTQVAVADAIKKQLPDMARAAVVERADRELPNMVQEGVQKAAEMIVPITSEKALSIMEGAANRLVPSLVKEAVGKATEHYVADKLARDIPQRVSTLVGSAVNEEVTDRIKPLTDKVLRSTAQRTFLLGVMLILVMVGLLAAGIYRVSHITKPLLEMQQQDLKGDNPFDWLMK